MTGAARPGVSPTVLVARRLASLRLLGPQDLAQLPDLGDERRAHPDGSELSPDRQDLLRLVVSGFVGECRLLSDGRRQIIRLRAPGDVVLLPRARDGVSVVALNRAQTVDAGPLARALADSSAPQVRNLRLAWEELERREQAALLDQIVRLGRMSAYERMAHFLLETHERLLRVGLATDAAFKLPVTQDVLGDLLGLSIVHVNRILKQLRCDGLVAHRAGTYTLLDRERLAGIAACAVPPPSRPQASPEPRLRTLAGTSAASGG